MVTGESVGDVAGERTLCGKDAICLFFIGKKCKVYFRSDVEGERTLWGKDAIFLFFLLAKSVRFTLEVILQVKGLCGGWTQFFFF